jgi:predicted amidohydrolase
LGAVPGPAQSPRTAGSDGGSNGRAGKKQVWAQVDLAILPETSVSGEAGGDALAHSFPFDGEVKETFTRKAREHSCYIVVPTYLLESKRKNACSNAAVLVGRKGEVVGTYRKVHLVVSLDRGTMEGGATPGDTLPVFDCDFGKLGIQICYDMEFEDGWAELERRGAELIAWPTQSPQTSQPAARAREHRFYIVSSTWRHNASIFEPTGKIAAQIKPPESILVHEVDLSYALLPWSAKLRNGEALRQAYGDKVGFHYYEDEDCGIFWSNDPKIAIGEMVRSIGVLELEEERERVRQFYRAARVRSSPPERDQYSRALGLAGVGHEHERENNLLQERRQGLIDGSPPNPAR